MFNGKFHYVYGHVQWQTVKLPEGISHESSLITNKSQLTMINHYLPLLDMMFHD